VATFLRAGIVKTAEDFACQSEYPIHGPLLDWLAVEFRERGWSMKTLDRLIVTSATYRQSSKVTPEHRARDDRTALRRASRMRMPRCYCATGPWPLGTARSTRGRRPVYPYQPDDVWEGRSPSRRSVISRIPRRRQRSLSPQLVHVWRRTVCPPTCLTLSNRQICRFANRHEPPLHALTTLNDAPGWNGSGPGSEQHEGGGRPRRPVDSRVSAAPPAGRDEKDLSILRRAYERQASIYKADPKAARAALSVAHLPRRKRSTHRNTPHCRQSVWHLHLDESLTRE